jgi:hypothetical protein
MSANFVLRFGYPTVKYLVRFQVLAAASMRRSFRVITPCSLVGID